MIRLATIHDAETLSALSMQSKRHWKYPEAHYVHWRAELTVSPAYIEQNDVFVYERRGTIIGYYSLVTLEKDTRVLGVSIEKGCWLDHLFVLPGEIGKGIGSTLFAHMARWCKAEEIAAVKILADPNSRGFYEKMGCLPEGAPFQHCRSHYTDAGLPIVTPGRSDQPPGGLDGALPLSRATISHPHNL